MISINFVLRIPNIYILVHRIHVPIRIILTGRRKSLGPQNTNIIIIIIVTSLYRKKLCFYFSKKKMSTFFTVAL